MSDSPPAKYALELQNFLLRFHAVVGEERPPTVISVAPRGGVFLDQDSLLAWSVCWTLSPKTNCHSIKGYYQSCEV